MKPFVIQRFKFIVFKVEGRSIPVTIRYIKYTSKPRESLFTEGNRRCLCLRVLRFKLKSGHTPRFTEL